MSDAELARVAAAQHAVFTTRDARRAGLTPTQIHHRVEAGWWESVYLNVYRVAGAPTTWEGDLLAACWAGGVRAAASHRSAAALWKLAGGRRQFAEVTCPRWRRARHNDLIVHETKVIEPIDLTHRGPIPVTTPERTLLDLGAVCHPSVVEMAVDAAESRGLVTVSSLRRTLDRLGRQGRNGAGVLRELLELQYGRPAVPESEMETMLFQVLRRNGLPEPVPQFEIRDANGRFVARVDAAYPDLRVAIEYDSVEHHTGRKKLVEDNARRNRIWGADWLLLVATVVDLKTGGSEFCRAVRAARRRAA